MRSEKRGNDIMFSGKTALKALSAAFLASCAMSGTSVSAAEISGADFMQKPIMSPTLDYLNDKGFTTQKALVDSAEPIWIQALVVTDDDGNLLDTYYMVEGSSGGQITDEQTFKEYLNNGLYKAIYAEQTYTMSQIEELGGDLSQLSKGNFKAIYDEYYNNLDASAFKDPTIISGQSSYTVNKVAGSGEDTIAVPDFDEKTNNLTQDYYQIDIKNKEFGDKSGDSIKYYNWVTEAPKNESLQMYGLTSVHNLVETTTDGDKVIKFHYNSESSPDFTIGTSISSGTEIENITGNYIGTEKPQGKAPDHFFNNSGHISNINANLVNLGVWNYRSGKIDNIKGDYLNSEIVNSGGQYGTIDVNFINGGIYNNSGDINIVKGSFIGTTGDHYIINKGKINYIFADFIGGYGDIGGAIKNEEGIIDTIVGDFIDNSAMVAGAIGSNSLLNNVYGNFISNKAILAAGAVGSGLGYGIDNVYGDFIGNSTLGMNFGDFVSGAQNFSMSAGGAVGFITGQRAMENISGNFLGNSANGYLSAGGAIMNLDVGFLASLDAGPDAEPQMLGITTINNISGNFIGNTAGTAGAIGNGTFLNIKKSEIGNITGNFFGNSAIVKKVELNDMDLQLLQAFLPKDGKNVLGKGGAIHNYYSTIGSITNSRFVGNFAKSEDEDIVAQGGAIRSTDNINLISDNGLTEFTDNYIENADGTKDDQAIYIANKDAKLNFSLINNGRVILNDNINGEKGYTVNINGDSSGSFALYNDIHNANVNIGNVNLNTINNIAKTYAFDSLTLTGNSNMFIDADLESKTIDRLTASSYGTHTGSLNVQGINLVSDAKTATTEILFADKNLKDNVTLGINNLPDEQNQLTAYTPIYKYNIQYDKRDDAGYFVFNRGGMINGGGSQNPSDSFNPSVLAAPVAAQAGATATMNQTFNYAFQNADNFMNIPYLERVSMKNLNKYAIAQADTTTSGVFSPLYTKTDSSSTWVKPYASFENIPLKNGPKVSNITYGTLVGYDTALTPMKHGWDRVWTGYIGYNGASQRYSGVNSIQNGGLLGGTLTLYKGNFFNATTISTGASVSNNQTMYGNENLTMLLAGIGNKAGYNFEFKEGKLIIQPSMLLSYTFVNTFDYTNAAGVKIKSDPLHAIQLAPGVKIIGNTRTGWQPYIGVNMIWNILDKSSVTANDTKLPEMSVKPYVQYGIGVQKRFKDNCMAFGQAMLQHGGRNGVSLTAGFRWAVGKEGKPIEKVENFDKKLGSNSLSVNTRLSTVQPHRTVLKQMSQIQKTTLTQNQKNTTRTTMKTGTIKAL